MDAEEAKLGPMDKRSDVAVRVIPCLDVDGGRVVKGVNFANLRDAGDPVELAAAYDAEGADELTFLDVTASSSGRATMLEVVARTADQVFIPLTVGGGVRTVADVDVLLRAGADKVSVNTAAIARPELLGNCPASSVRSASCSRSTPVRSPPVRHRPPPDGRSPPTAAGRERALMPSNGRSGASNSAWGDPAEFDGCRRDQGGIRSGHAARGARRGERAGDCQRGAGAAEHFAPAVAAGADAVLAASVFHFRELTIGQVKAAMSAEGIVVR